MNPILAAGLVLLAAAVLIFLVALVVDLIRYSKRWRWQHATETQRARGRSTYPAVGVALILGILGAAAAFVGAVLALAGLS